MRLCGHHPLSPRIIWSSQSTSWTAVTHFNDRFPSRSQWRHFAFRCTRSDRLACSEKSCKQTVSCEIIKQFISHTLARTSCHLILWNSSNPSSTSGGSDALAPFRQYVYSALTQAQVDALHFLLNLSSTRRRRSLAAVPATAASAAAATALPAAPVKKRQR